MGCNAKGFSPESLSVGEYEVYPSLRGTKALCGRLSRSIRVPSSHPAHSHLGLQPHSSALLFQRC